MSAAVFVVDDDRSIRLVLARALKAAGFLVREFESAQAFRAALDAGAPDALFLDVRMPNEDGLSVLKSLKRTHPTLPVIVMSAYADLQSTVRAFSDGALEFLAKPFDLNEAVQLVERALEATRALDLSELEPTRAELIGESAAMAQLYRAIGRLTRTSLNVLIQGETGTGKELVARALHRHSPRAHLKLVAINTAAIPAELLESELFGHERGAFTGAQSRRIGRFEQANGGTLFLDEIGDMPLGLQTRLLRVLASKEFYRVGGTDSIHCDVRVIAATHQDLRQKVREGSFRADLLHRLDVIRIELPALRERATDVPVLAQHFLRSAASELNLDEKHFDESALSALAAHDWPGNVRELENLCRRLTALNPTARLGLNDVQRELSAQAGQHESDWSKALKKWAQQALARGDTELLSKAMKTLEDTLIDTAITHHQGHLQDAARSLGIGRNTIARKKKS